MKKPGLRTKRKPQSRSAPQSKTPRAPVADRGDTAKAILKAADELFCQRGFDAVSVADIAERAGSRKALVFYHWRSKEALFERVLEEYYRANQAALADAFQAGGTMPERLHQMVDALFDFMVKYGRYVALVQREVQSAEVHPVIQRNLAPFFRWIEKTLAEVTPEEGPLAARHFYLTFSAVMNNYFTYAPVLRGLWNRDPLGPGALEERRAHVHWLVDTLLEAIPRAGDSRPRPATG